MRRSIRSTTVLVLLAAISACGGGSSNPIAPQFQPEVINNADSFSFQVTGVQNASSTLTYTWQNTGTTATVNAFPEVADVMVRILTEEGAAMLDNLEHGRLAAKPQQYLTNADWWWGIVQEHSKVYVRRIEIKGGAL